MLNSKLSLPEPGQALPGRSAAMALDNTHYVHGRPMQGPYPELGEHARQIVFGMGCFWGVERKFWSIDGVYTTAVGYLGGITPNPSYEEVCTGLTGHNEVVLVVYDEREINFTELLKVFLESHDPTQGMRQGNDRGTQYRSGIYYFSDQQRSEAQAALATFEQSLNAAGFAPITTELQAAGEFYYAEQYHQQYLAKNPNGYCSLAGTGVSCTI